MLALPNTIFVSSPPKRGPLVGGSAQCFDHVNVNKSTGESHLISNVFGRLVTKAYKDGRFNLLQTIDHLIEFEIFEMLYC